MSLGSENSKMLKGRTCPEGPNVPRINMNKHIQVFSYVGNIEGHKERNSCFLKNECHQSRFCEGSETGPCPKCG